MKPAKIPVKQCRVCHSDNVRNLGTEKLFYLMNLDETVTTGYGVCVDCQFIFQSDYVGDEFLNYYYTNSPMLRRKEATPYEVDQNSRQAAFLTKHINLDGMKVVEIGAHAGAFLVHLKEHHNCKPYFDELSEEAKNVLSSQDGLVDYRSEAMGEKMDLVVLRHVLEHIFDLDGFLSYVRSITKEAGYLYVEVPDWGYLDGKTDPLVFEHLNQFSTYNLMLLLRRAGWQCEAVEKSIAPTDPATPNRVQRFLMKPNPLARLGDTAIVSDFQKFNSSHHGGGVRALNAFIEKAGKGKTIALYPTSHATFTALHESNLRSANIIGMFDIDPKKSGKEVLGVKTFHAETLKQAKPDIILLFTWAYEKEIRDYFRELGIESEIISINQFVSGAA